MLLYNEGGFVVGATKTDEKGNYNFVNLVPGSYSIKVDVNQLKALNYKALPLTQQIKIEESNIKNSLTSFDFMLMR